MVSELLEEMGVDRDKLRKLRRQALEGVILFCQWQLEKTRAEPQPRAGTARGKGRRIPVE